MKITIESTSRICQLQVEAGKHALVMPARIWEGKTERGTPVHCYVVRICPTIETKDLKPGQIEEFERDLRECAAPSPMAATIPLRMIL